MTTLPVVTATPLKRTEILSDVNASSENISAVCSEIGSEVGSALIKHKQEVRTVWTAQSYNADTIEIMPMTTIATICTHSDPSIFKDHNLLPTLQRPTGNTLITEYRTANEHPPAYCRNASRNVTF